MLDPLLAPISLSVKTKPQTTDLPQRKLLKQATEKDEYVIEMDYSAITNFMRCPRQAENYSVHGRELAKDQSALSFGRLFHKLEALRLNHGLTDAVVQRQHEEIASHFVYHPPSATDHRNADCMFQTIKKYNDRYKNDQLEKMIFQFEGEPMVERPFKIALCTLKIDDWIPYRVAEVVGENNKWEITVDANGFFYAKKIHILYCGRIDAVFEQNNQLWIDDNKSTSRGGKEFEEAFRLSLQTRGYGWAVWKLTGRRPMGAIVNGVIVRPPTKTGKGTEFNRSTYFYSEDSLTEWEDNMKAHVSDFVGCLVRGFWPQSAQSFKSPCAGCDYQDNCALPRDQRAADLASDIYRDVTWNPMLEQ
jgi:hypothetical protein